MKQTIVLEKLLQQVMELYQTILTNQDKTLELSPEIKLAIRTLAQQIEDISQMTDHEVAKLGLSQEQLKKTILEPNAKMNPELQTLLEKSNYVKGQLEGCRNVLKDIMKKQKEEKSHQKGMGDKRKDKFKNVGGKKGWIPL